jgi:hypothetical protein
VLAREIGNQGTGLELRLPLAGYIPITILERHTSRKTGSPGICAEVSRDPHARSRSHTTADGTEHDPPQVEPGFQCEPSIRRSQDRQSGNLSIANHVERGS